MSNLTAFALGIALGALLMATLSLLILNIWKAAQ
jgi:hypothetical protein